MARILLIASACVGLSALSAEEATKKLPAASPLADLDTIVTKELERWKVPGVALAIVKDGKIVLTKGWGFRNLEKKLPVTARTRFAIASDTKSFTAASLALLVDEGKIEWDQPVRRYLTDFQLRDPAASERLTPRDLLCHNSGLPRHDAVWIGAKISRAEIVRRLRYLEPSKDFRTTFQYQNMMFVTAGQLAAQVAGTTWEEFLARRLFIPLEMCRTNFTPGALDATDDDFSIAYLKEPKDQGGKVKKIPFYRDDEMGPAGSIYSSAEDMAHWIGMKLAGGQWNGKTVLTSAQVAAMQTPAMPDPNARLDPEIGDTSYGLGVDITTYRGHRWVFHGGNLYGFASIVTHLPDDNAGVVVLTNLDSTPCRDALARLVTDRLLGLSPIDWGARMKARQEKGEASEDDAKAKKLTPRKPGTTPAHPLEEYAGEFEHPAYGVVEVARAGDDGFELRFHGFKLPLRHFHFETWDTPEEEGNILEKAKVMFLTGWSGEVERLAIPFEREVADIVFTRRPDAAMRQPDFLGPLTGAYELGALPITITLRGADTVVLNIPGQGSYELLPRRGTTFNLKGLSGCSIEFRRDASGAVPELVFYQPDGTFTAKRRP